MNETETTSWREMLQSLHGNELQERVLEGEDGKQQVEFEFQLIHDDRRGKWQKILLDAIDDDAVFGAVCQFFYERFEEKVRRCEAGEPWTDDTGTVLIFPNKGEEHRAAAERAFIFGMSDVIQRLKRKWERKHRLKEMGWYDHVDHQHMDMLLHEILLDEYVVPNPDL